MFERKRKLGWIVVTGHKTEIFLNGYLKNEDDVIKHAFISISVAQARDASAASSITAAALIVETLIASTLCHERFNQREPRSY